MYNTISIAALANRSGQGCIETPTSAARTTLPFNEYPLCKKPNCEQRLLLYCQAVASMHQKHTRQPVYNVLPWLPQQ